jgi:hypothetical protein
LCENCKCGNCGAGIGRDSLGNARDICPECRWSKHVQFGYLDEGIVPCSSLMRPVKVTGRFVTLECTGCDMTYITPAPRYAVQWATRQGRRLLTANARLQPRDGFTIWYPDYSLATYKDGTARTARPDVTPITGKVPAAFRAA